MAIITIQKDRFNEFFERSIVKYFNDLVNVNSRGEVFNQIYTAKFNSDDIDYQDILDTKKGIIILEKSLTQRNEKSLGGVFKRELVESGSGVLDSDIQISDKDFEFSGIVLNKDVSIKIGTGANEEYITIKKVSGTTASVYGFLQKDHAATDPIVLITDEIKADGFVYYADLQIRVITDTNQREGAIQKHGKPNLLSAQSFINEVLKTEKIPFFDFENNITTSMNIQFDYNLLEYTEIPMAYQDYQEGIFTLPIWCDVYETSTDSIIIDTDFLLDKRT